MSVFSQLKQQLYQQLQQKPVAQGLVQLQAEIAIDLENQQLLAWLKAQPLFPHYYWQNRDTEQTIVAVGAVQTFEHLDDVEQFSKQSDLMVVGGIEFEGQCHFVLPRLLLVKNEKNITAWLNLDGRHFESEQKECIALLAQFEQTAELHPIENSLLSTKVACDFSRWQHNIELAIEQIQQQQMNKVVLANATTKTFTHLISPYVLLFASQQKNLGCYHFLWSEKQGEAFIGSTPERLYLRQQRQFFTEALAGTVAVTDDPVQTEQNALWLLNDQKNIYENWLVVDDICSHLADCATDIQVSDAEIKRLHNVQHLRRKIQTQLTEQVSDADCLARIHPTAAVAGLPRPKAKQFIQQQECFERGWYAGALGYFTPEQAEFCVMLRSALIQANQITFYAGAGIVEKSDPQSEWQEIDRKARAMVGLME
ncbi:isochorismate synthase [Glaesserella parasuis]|uniref:Isochorismate synthase MenF n=1 Tax=Glaesserella parasuis TaxID=738 RepID=A0AA42JGE8_GLAPU|nr:isochorismate synthase [Glaesserella parasuis]AWY44830.1 isochorismate synthase [Glaesserella parasuis 29755]KEZ23885.1 Menaquinone-specific isochorismate synthase [Glaesserella parasuis]MCT8573047.1 isochorismate synthase [Glaesserella parasuis]MCT8654712.1 isochorismate synthase [Glaesserella parasuis]MCT8823817.1 isochorismate synthase [Glaesserella parasuis]